MEFDMYLEREIELNQLHEDILSRREVLLRHSEWRLGHLERKRADSAANSALAKQRNKTLLEDITKVQSEFRGRASKGPSPKLQAFQESYHAMLESEIPVWKEGLRTAKKSPRSPRPPISPQR
ncbi:centrosomal protein 15-like [Ptychodera flava]|uniref:centrosomal protein 15-like n=1 Tax=Ptychodera flava TaxID=63121 RepID=UPI00396A7C92